MLMHLSTTNYLLRCYRIKKQADRLFLDLSYFLIIIFMMRQCLDFVPFQDEWGIYFETKQDGPFFSQARI